MDDTAQALAFSSKKLFEQFISRWKYGKPYEKEYAASSQGILPVTRTLYTRREELIVHIEAAWREQCVFDGTQAPAEFPSSTFPDIRDSQQKRWCVANYQYIDYMQMCMTLPSTADEQNFIQSVPLITVYSADADNNFNFVGIHASPGSPYFASADAAKGAAAPRIDGSKHPIFVILEHLKHQKETLWRIFNAGGHDPVIERKYKLVEKTFHLAAEMATLPIPSVRALQNILLQGRSLFLAYDKGVEVPSMVQMTMPPPEGMTGRGALVVFGPRSNFHYQAEAYHTLDNFLPRAVLAMLLSGQYPKLDDWEAMAGPTTQEVTITGITPEKIKEKTTAREHLRQDYLDAAKRLIARVEPVAFDRALFTTSFYTSSIISGRVSSAYGSATLSNPDVANPERIDYMLRRDYPAREYSYAPILSMAKSVSLSLREKVLVTFNAPSEQARVDLLNIFTTQGRVDTMQPVMLGVTGHLFITDNTDHDAHMAVILLNPETKNSMSYLKQGSLFLGRQLASVHMPIIKQVTSMLFPGMEKFDAAALGFRGEVPFAYAMEVIAKFFRRTGALQGEISKEVMSAIWHVLCTTALRDVFLSSGEYVPFLSSEHDTAVDGVPSYRPDGAPFLATDLYRLGYHYTRGELGDQDDPSQRLYLMTEKIQMAGTTLAIGGISLLAAKLIPLNFKTLMKTLTTELMSVRFFVKKTAYVATAGVCRVMYEAYTKPPDTIVNSEWAKQKASYAIDALAGDVIFVQIVHVAILIFYVLAMAMGKIVFGDKTKTTGKPVKAKKGKYKLPRKKKSLTEQIFGRAIRKLTPKDISVAMKMHLEGTPISEISRKLLDLTKIPQ